MDDLGYLADTPAANAILEGTYCPNTDVDDNTTTFLRHLKRPADVPTTSVFPYLSSASHSDGWKKMKETTKASPDGPAFTELKACAQHSVNASDDAAFATTIP